jgi:hypothetical protein
MGFWARNKSYAGGRGIPTVASATAIELSPAYNVFYISGTTTIGSINANSPIIPGREVTLIGTSSVTLTSAGASTTKGAIDGGAGNITLIATGIVKLIQRHTGDWLKVLEIDN